MTRAAQIVRVALHGAAALSIAGGPCAAAPKDAKDAAMVTVYEKADKRSIFAFDYGPPVSPATSLLGLSNDQTAPTTILTKFVVQLPTLLEKNGSQALVGDFPIVRLWQRESSQTFSDYISNGPIYRIGQRTRISAGGLTGSDGGGDAAKAVRSRAAIGFSTSLLDASDPIMHPGPDGAPLLRTCLTPLEDEARQVTRRPIGQLPSVFEKTAYQTASALILKGDLARADAHLKTWHAQMVAKDQKDAGTAAAEDDRPMASGDARRRAAPLAAAKQALDEMDRAGELSPKQRVLFQALVALAERDQPAPAAASAPALPQRVAPPDLATLGEAGFRSAVEARKVALDDTLAKEVAKNEEANTAALAKVKLPERFDRCAKLAGLAARFSPALTLGGGQLWRGEAGRFQGFDPGGSVLWASGKIPIPGTVHLPKIGELNEKTILTYPSRAWLFAVSGRFGDGEFVATGNKATPEVKARTYNVWAGVERISPDRRFAAQYGWVKVDALRAGQETFSNTGERYLVSAQFRLGDDKSGSWLGLSYGNAYGTIESRKSTTALITYSFSPPAAPAPSDIGDGR